MNENIADLVRRERALYKTLHKAGADSVFGRKVVEVLGYYPRGTSAAEEIRAHSSKILPYLTKILSHNSEVAALSNLRKQVIEANVNLVKKWASIIHKQWTYSSFEYMDLFQEGIIGITKALDRFDPDRGFKFSTYASYWIKHLILRSAAIHDKVVRAPVNINSEIHEIEKERSRLLREFGREPTEKEIAEGISRMTATKVKSRLESGVNPMIFSLDEELDWRSKGSTDGYATWKDLLIAQHCGEYLDYTDLARGRRVSTDMASLKSCSEVEVSIDRRKVQTLVEESLSVLSSREQTIIIRRYGLDGRSSQTLKQVGDELGLTRERIRQIEVVAIRKLKKRIGNRNVRMR